MFGDRWHAVAFGLALLLLGVGVTTWLVPRLDIPTRFWTSPVETVTVSDRALRLVRVPYRQGLQDVPSLGSLDGALIVLEAAANSESGMTMEGVEIPLDVVFFDPGGRFIERDTMAVCEGVSCPVYRPSRTWQFAIEGLAGSLAWVARDATLDRSGDRLHERPNTSSS